MANHVDGNGSVASVLDTATTSSISARQQAHQRGTAGQVRRSSLINAPGDTLARNRSYSEAVSATSLDLADQATLSQPTTPSVQHLLQNSRARSTSTSTVDAPVDQYETTKSASSKARRNTLAGTSTYQSLAAAASCLSLNSGSTITSSRLTRIIFPTTNTTTLSSSIQTPVPVAPVPARANSEPFDSTARGSLVLHPVPAAETPELPHIHLPHPLVHTQSDLEFPAHSTLAVDIPTKDRDTSEPVAPLTGRFREGLPTSVHAFFNETAAQREQRLALLPYYTRNDTKPPPSLRSCSSAGSLSSKCSSTYELPTGALSLLSTRSKKGTCSQEGHRHCPSSPSRTRRRRRASHRPSPRIHTRSQEDPDGVPMRTSSAASSLGYTPTSPLSPGSPRGHPAIMQPNRNQNGHARRPPQGFSLPIPRFHPAMYQSPSASNASTAANSPRNLRSPVNLPPPMSPRTQQRSEEAKQALFTFQSDLLRTTGASGAPLDQKLPGTPSLVPARSPGEATPLTLEDGPGDYLTAGAARRGQHAGATSQRELVERMIREEEERRRQGNSSVPSSAPVSPAAGP